MLIDWVTEPHKESRKNFKNIRTIFCTLLLFLKFHYVRLEAILKRLQGSFQEEVGELKYGSPAVVNSQSLKLNISYFPNTLKWQLAHILKRAKRSIFIKMQII